LALAALSFGASEDPAALAAGACGGGDGFAFVGEMTADGLSVGGDTDIGKQVGRIGVIGRQPTDWLIVSRNFNPDPLSHDASWPWSNGRIKDCWAERLHCIGIPAARVLGYVVFGL
jgi:hypothetical protein